ncbi:TPA: endonuclease domain-containing protein [Campylobacter jejuni]
MQDLKPRELKTYEIEELIVLNTKTAKELRDSMVESNPICPLCGSKIFNPVLDHKHSKKQENLGAQGAGLVRNVICSTCNIFLGKMENNYKRYRIQNLSDFLRNAANYLETDTTPYVYPSEAKKLKEIFPKSLYNKLIKAIHLETKKDINYIKKKIKHTKYLSQKTKDLLISYGLYS